jgi:hypothetical protein
MNCDREQGRFYTYVEYKRGKKPKEIFDALCEVFGDDGPGYSTVKRWAADFTSGQRMSCEDESRCGRPVSGCGDGNVELIKRLVEDCPSISIRSLAGDSGVPYTTVQRILRDQLKYRWIASYWVPMTLNANQRQHRVDAARAIRDRLLAMGDERYTRYVCEDETWIRFDLENTRSSARVWIPQGTSRPQIPSNKLTARKCLLAIAFTMNKRVNVKAFPYGESIDGEGYLAFVSETGEKWRKLRSSPVKLNELAWQHDNARPHIKKCVQEFFTRKGLEWIHQSPYSPDFNLCDRWLNNHLKQSLRNEVFNDSMEVEARVVQLMRAVDENEYRRQLDLLIEHFAIVIADNGEYITPS